MLVRSCLGAWTPALSRRVGAGGLGAPAALYLAAAGVGTIGLIDDDDVDVSNLQRQVIHATASVGRPKVDSAAEAIRALNPDVEVVAHQTRLTAANALDLLGDWDVVIDGTLMDVWPHLEAAART